MTQIQIGPRITAARIAKKQSRQQLAEATGFSIGAITSWELGKRYPRLENLEDLAEALGVKVASFFSESSDPHETPRAA